MERPVPPIWIRFPTDLRLFWGERRCLCVTGLGERERFRLLSRPLLSPSLEPMAPDVTSLVAGWLEAGRRGSGQQKLKTAYPEHPPPRHRFY